MPSHLSKEQEKMLNELCDLEDGLSKWEMDFIDSLDKQTNPLSMKQAAKLAEIYDDKITYADKVERPYEEDFNDE